jgi:hypothetical protein
MKYVTFLWSPLEAAVSILTLAFFVKNDFLRRVGKRK